MLSNVTALSCSTRHAKEGMCTDRVTLKYKQMRLTSVCLILLGKHFILLIVFQKKIIQYKKNNEHKSHD